MTKGPAAAAFVHGELAVPTELLGCPGERQSMPRGLRLFWHRVVARHLMKDTVHFVVLFEAYSRAINK